MKRKLLVTLGLIMILFSLSFTYADSISLELYVGQTHALQSRVIDEAGFDVNEDVEWTSSDSDIASVKDGLITAKSEGNAVITATVSEGASLRSFSIYLTSKTTVKSVELNIPQDTLYVGEEMTANYTLTPARDLTAPIYDEVSFTTSDKSVFTVDDDGVVKGVGEGDAFLKVITDDGNRTSMKKITVKGMVKSIKIQSDITKLYVGEERTLSVSIEPENAFNKDYEWSSSSHVDLDDDGSFVAESEGIAYISVLTEDGSKKDTIKFEVESLVSGIEITSEPIELTDTRSTYQLNADLIEKKPGIPPVEDGIEWSSNRSSVASVSKNGLVSAKSTGYAIITATSKDGNYSDSITLHIKLGEKSVIEAKSIAFTTEKKNARSGEPCLLYYKLLPENTTEDDLDVDFHGGDGNIDVKDGYIEFIPYDEGRYTITIETENELRDYTYIDVSSNLSEIVIDSNGLIRNRDTGRYSVYLGQSGQLDYTLVKKNSAPAILLKDAKWDSGDDDIIDVDSDGSYYGNEIGDTYIQIEALDNNVTELIHIEVISMSDSAELPAYAEIGIKTTFKPTPFFTPKEDLLYGYNAVLDKSYNLEIDAIYLPEAFVKNERDFEKERQKKLEDWIEQGSGDKESLQNELEKSKKRHSMLRLFLKNSEDDYVEVNYDDFTMTDRSFNTLDIAEIDDNAFYANVICKADLSIITNDGEHEDTMTVYADAENTDFLVYDTDGNLLNYEALLNDLNLDAQTQAAKNETTRQLTESEAAAIESLKANYANLSADEVPRDDTITALETAKKFGMVLPSFTENYQRAITKLEMAEICFKLYDHYTGEITGVYPYNIFTDTDNPIAIRAYHYGLVPFTEDRKFNPDAQLTREEMAYMLYRTFVALDMPISSAVSPPKGSTFIDQDLISDDYALAVGQLAYKYTIITGITDERFEPQASASIDYTLKYAINLAKSLTEE